MVTRALKCLKMGIISQLVIVFFLSLLSRLLYLLKMGLLACPDSGQYLNWGQQLAHGDFTVLLEYPLHFLYPAVLALGHLLGLPEKIWLFHIQLISSSLLPVVIFLIVNRIKSQPSLAPFFGSLVVILNPYFIHWTPYILTETLFLFLLGLFTLSAIKFLQTMRSFNLFTLIFTGILFGLSRPTAPPLLLVSIFFIITYCCYYKYGTKSAILSLIVCIMVLGTFAGYIFVKPKLRGQVLSIPTIYQSLWLSTRLSNSSIENIQELINPPAVICEKGTEAVRRYKIDYAVNFITNHPFKYVKMAAERFLSFWYPWIYADWSTLHKIIDAFISIMLTSLALFSLFRNKDEALLLKLFILTSALTLAILTSFSQIDSDGRYRLPAELLLIPLMVSGVSSLINSKFLGERKGI